MAEYKAKLLNELFTNAKRVLLSTGENVDAALKSSDYSIVANSNLGSISQGSVVKNGNRLIVFALFTASANSISGQEIFAVKKNNQAISCNTGFAVGKRLTNDGNGAYCPVTAAGLITAGPSFPIISGKIYEFNYVMELT